MNSEKKIKIILGEGEEAVEATAILLKEKAPNTCKLIWDNLPLDVYREEKIPNTKRSRWFGRAFHHTWSGDGIACVEEVIEGMEWENYTIHAGLGVVAWCLTPDTLPWIKSPNMHEIFIEYGYSRWRTRRGDQRANVFAQIVGDANDFFDACHMLIHTGSKRLVVKKKSK